jgi:Flp pilus assembly protein TadG
MKRESNAYHARKNERGGVLAYTVIAAVFLFFAVGLSADLSHLYLVKTELQNTADAAALAGASALTIPITNPDRIQTAVDRAINVMNLNKYNLNSKNYVDTQDLASQRDLVEFATNLNGVYKKEGDLSAAETASARFVRVRTPDVPVNILFSFPILGLQRNIDAVATAGLSVAGNANFCPGPLAVLECGADNPQCLGPDPDGPGPGKPPQFSMGGICNAGGPAPNPDGSACDPSKQFCKNCVYTIRAGPSSGPAPGNYHGLCCPGENCGADWLRDRLAGGNNCSVCPPVAPGDEVAPTTKPGVNAGPVRQGINTRFDIYNAGLNPTDHPPDTNIYGDSGNEIMTWAQYKAGSPFQPPSNPPQAHRRVIILPITPFSSWFDANGRDTVRVSSLQGFFIQQKIPNGNGGDLKAEFVGDEVIAAIGFDPNNVNNANVVTWVLYR